MLQPIKYKNKYIHEYQWGDKEVNYIISSREEEAYIDEEEAESFNLPLKKYQEILKSFGAKQYHHEFVYNDIEDTKKVQDSYFDSIKQCQEAIDYLNKEDSIC